MLPSLPLPSAQQPATEPEQAASPAVIREGDLVIVYENPSSMKAVTVKSGNRYDNKFGSFPHKVRPADSPAASPSRAKASPQLAALPPARPRLCALLPAYFAPSDVPAGLVRSEVWVEGLLKDRVEGLDTPVSTNTRLVDTGAQRPALSLHTAQLQGPTAALTAELRTIYGAKTVKVCRQLFRAPCCVCRVVNVFCARATGLAAPHSDPVRC